MHAVLFDLDDTLINSSHLRELRDGGSWHAVERKIESIQPFEGITEMLHDIRSRDIRIGVVTNSPRDYSERVLSHCQLPYDALVAGGEVRFGKPACDPTQECLRQLGGIMPQHAVAVGDRCVDVRSARAMHVPAIGAMWACPNPRDLKLSRPEHLAFCPKEVTLIVAQLFGEGDVETHSWWPKFRSNLWIFNPDWDRREHLATCGISYGFARVDYGGNLTAWRRSFTNQLVSNLKSKQSNQRWHKNEAANLFAFELSHVLPHKGFVVFVMPSAIKGTPEYDDRWELVQHHLETTYARTDLQFQQAIQGIRSSTPAHLQDASSRDRDPAEIASRLAWTGGIPNGNVQVAVVDDVLTKGGHLRAYHDIIKAHCPLAQVHLLPWAAFTNQAWHETPAKALH